MTPKCWTENPTFGGHIMSKISNEIRLEAVQRVVEDGMSISASARLAGVHKSMLQEWIMQYREHGAEGVIKQDRKQKKYWRIQNRSGRICAYEPSLGRAPFKQIRRMAPSPNPTGRPSGKKEQRKPQNSQKKDCQTGQSMI